MTAHYKAAEAEKDCYWLTEQKIIDWLTASIYGQDINGEVGLGHNNDKSSQFIRWWLRRRGRAVAILKNIVIDEWLYGRRDELTNRVIGEQALKELIICIWTHLFILIYD